MTDSLLQPPVPMQRQVRVGVLYDAGYVGRLQRLTRYVQHSAWCSAGYGGARCTCGLAELVGELERDVRPATEARR